MGVNESSLGDSKRFKKEKWTSEDTRIDQFDKVEYLDAGGLDTFYKEKCRDGYIVSWDSIKNWLRKSELKYICLSLHTFEHTKEFLQEVNDIIQWKENPTTNEYLICTAWESPKNENKEFGRLDWYEKFKIIFYIAFGLSDNVVLESLITNFGLCKQIYGFTENEQNKIYGVIPYTAPEMRY
ncbi:hypothetical protein Glove_87g180 [Diversispora epigaea]|uniref:Uncharacterized protein n=1 Tax=Diversispora epigaea TaxID=1348612 RepID=A0A397JGV0_9GLOM|nr:hypothetical protein Glove_87g180 [Diversispora epigaea]